jgi:hypothetical protein
MPSRLTKAVGRALLGASMAEISLIAVKRDFLFALIWAPIWVPPPHPFTAGGRTDFDALLQSKWDMVRGRLLICDMTISRSAVRGLDNLKRFWRNVVSLKCCRAGTGYTPSKTPRRMQPDAHRHSETGHRMAGKIMLDCQIMRGHRFFKGAVLTPLLLSALGGCEVRGAPSFGIVGSYFPGWMFCALIGIVSTIAVRVGFVASGLDNVLPFQLFVCSAIGLCCGLLAWLLWFGQ